MQGQLPQISNRNPSKIRDALTAQSMTDEPMTSIMLKTSRITNELNQPFRTFDNSNECANIETTEIIENDK